MNGVQLNDKGATGSAHCFSFSNGSAKAMSIE